MPTVIITGARGYLGDAVKNIFLVNGHHVISCISPRDASLKAENVLEEILKVDLSDAENCKSLVESVSVKHPTIHAAVLTVGGFALGHMEAVGKQDFEKMFSLNFLTAFNMIQPLVRQMKTQKAVGKIFLIGSTAGMNGSEARGAVAYGFSKSLLFRLAELINATEKKNNISAFVIVPSTIDTPQNRAAMPGADFSKWVLPEKIAKGIFEICQAKQIKDTIIMF